MRASACDVTMISSVRLGQAWRKYFFSAQGRQLRCLRLPPETAKLARFVCPRMVLKLFSNGAKFWAS
jgi:hypothetical protein